MITTLSALLLFDGAIHLLLAPAHRAESPLLGAGFLLCGLAQLVLGVMVVRQNSLAALVLIGVVSVLSLAVYLLAVTIGLPMWFSSGPMPMSHSMVGAPIADMMMRESVTPLGVISKVAELATIASAASLAYVWRAHEPPRSTRSTLSTRLGRPGPVRAASR